MAPPTLRGGAVRGSGGLGAGGPEGGRDPEGGGAPNRPAFPPGVRSSPPLVGPNSDSIKAAPFDMAVSIESGEPFSRPSALVKLAAVNLQQGGILVLSMPYGGYLRNLLITVREWWNLPRFAVWDGGHMQRWSRKCLTMLLKSHGFTVMEFIGVRNRCAQWEALILVARKID